MSRLYDEHMKRMKNRLPKVYRKKDVLEAAKKPPIQISVPLKGGSEPKELNEDFINALKREYAVRYLESMGVDPTPNMIRKFLKEAPLKACDIKGGWQSSSWLADVVHIYPSGNTNKDLSLSSRETSGPALVDSALNPKKEDKPLKREFSGLLPKHFRPQVSAKSITSTEDVTTSQKKHPDMNIELIKKNYLEPFKSRRDAPSSPEPEPWPPRQIQQSTGPSMASAGDLMESKLFQFPLDSITVDHDHIREIQLPIEATLQDITSDLEYIKSHFPKHSIAADKTDKVENSLDEIVKDDMARLIGLVAHFAYWAVFGHAHSVPIDDYQRGQIFLSIVHTFNEMKTRFGKSQTTMAISLLALRLVVDNIFQNSYKRFFSIPEQAKAAQDKISVVVSKLLDPEGFIGRISFLESGLDAVNANLRNKKKTKAAFYSVSSQVQSLFPKPEHPRARALLARKQNYDGKLDTLVKTGAQISGTFNLPEGKLNYYQSSEPWKQSDYLDTEIRAQLFHIAQQSAKKVRRQS